MKVGSLFTGYGGLDMAVGGDLAWYAEIEPAACKVLSAHYPNVPNLGDITTIKWTEVQPVDILTGGYPCQPFSHAGQRKGKNDERHLWPYVLDAIRGIRPRYAILENVSGHLSLGFDIVLTDLAEIGWACEWGTFRASDVGAPHRRERLFIVAYANSQGSQGKNIGLDLAKRGHNSNGHSAQGDHLTITNTGSERHGSGQRSRGLEAMGSETESSRWETSPTWQESRTVSTSTVADTEHDGLVATERRGSIRASATSGDFEQSQDGQRQPSRGSDSRVVITSDSKHHGLDGGAFTRGIGESQDQGWVQQSQGRYTDTANTDYRHESSIRSVQGFRSGYVARPDMSKLPDIDWGKYNGAVRRWEAVLGRPAPEPTVERNDKRRLNPQFVEWMMGLPDGWVTGHGLSAAQELKMLGNGVVPQQAHAAITQLMQRVQSWAS